MAYNSLRFSDRFGLRGLTHERGNFAQGTTDYDLAVVDAVL